jgi:hypothetical protein
LFGCFAVALFLGPGKGPRFDLGAIVPSMATVISPTFRTRQPAASSNTCAKL